MTEDERAGVTPSSGNVFADLGFDDPEAELAEAHRRSARERLARIAWGAWRDGLHREDEATPIPPWDAYTASTRAAWADAAAAVAAEVRRQERTRFAALHGTLAALHGTAAQIDRCYRCGWVKLARPDEDARHFHDLERQLAALDEDEP